VALDDMNIFDWVLVSDQLGNRYAVPWGAVGNRYAASWETVENQGAAPEERAEAEEVPGASVAGRGTHQDFIHQEIADQHQAERPQEAAQEHGPDRTPQAVSSPGANQATDSFIRGMWVRLPFIRHSPLVW
jgi:hypothetical protein